jgi:hypothetical protein
MNWKQIVKLLLFVSLTFLIQTAFLPSLVVQSLDLVFLAVVACALKWRLEGALLAGVTAGFLTGIVSSTPLFKVAFFYTVLAYISSLLLDGCKRLNLPTATVLSAVLTTYFVLAQIALFSPGGIGSLGKHTLLEALPLFASLLVLLQISDTFLIQNKKSGKRELALGSILR